MGNMSETPNPQSLVDQYLRDLDSEAEEKGEDVEGGSSQEVSMVEPSASGVASSQEVESTDSQELDLLVSQGKLGWYLGSS